MNCGSGLPLSFASLDARTAYCVHMQYLLLVGVGLEVHEYCYRLCIPMGFFHGFSTRNNIRGPLGWAWTPTHTHRQGKEVLTLQRRRPSIERGIVVQTHTTSRADTHHVSSPKQSVLKPDRHSHGPIVVPRIYLCAIASGQFLRSGGSPNGFAHKYVRGERA